MNLSASHITSLHDRLVTLWHLDDRAEADDANDAFLSRVARQHRANFELWHIEDE